MPMTEDNKLTVDLCKQCRCKGSSSGPRLIVSAPHDTPTGYTIKAQFFRMACNVCDKPWAYELTGEVD